MKRLRMAAFAAVAGLAFVPGCCCFDSQMLNRMGLGPRPQQDSCCECNTCGGQVISEGPVLGEGPYLPPAGGVMEQGPQPRLDPKYAQPMPAPVSTTKIKN